MNITTSLAPQAGTLLPRSKSVTLAEEAPAAPTESFQPSERPGTPIGVKAGKWALAAATSGGAAALGWYAGANLGTAAGAAGAVIGGLSGAVALGAVGMFLDLASGFGSSSNKTLPAAIVGGVLGGVAGGAAGALTSNPLAGTVLAIAGGATAFVVTGAATNILAK
jgi:hypothetical protein